MEERRRAWWASGFALVLAATTGAAAVHLWWLPCRGTMLVGTPLASFGDAADVADGCVDRMGEGTPFPLPTAAASSSPGLLALIVVTIVAVAVAWLLPVLTEPLSGTSRLVAALPGFAALGVAVLAVGIAYDVPGAEEVAYPLATFLNLLVVSGFAVLLGQVGTWPRHLVTALALSSMGFAGPIVNYLLMVHWSDLNWDAPPGSGYLTAAFLLVCGIAVLALTFLRRPAPPMAARRVPAEVAA